jgi:hypothetical protein
MPVTGFPPTVICVAPPFAARLYTCCTNPVAVGEKVKFRLQLPPAGRLAPQFVTIANGDVTDPSVNVTDAFVELVNTVP